MKIFFLFSISVISASFAYAQNLILNPGNELPLVGGEIQFWTEVVGTAWTQATSQGPYEGSYYFYGGANPIDEELRQDIDVSSLACSIDNGIQDFSFIGYVKSYNQSPADLSQVVIEFRNSSNTTVLSKYDSGTNNNVTWKKISTSKTAPSGTRWIRIRLISTWQNGGNSDDGIYDSLSLVATPVTVPSPIELGNDTALCTGNTLKLDATVAGASYLWSDNSKTATLTTAAAGKYWVQVTDNSCIFSDTIDVTFNTTPTVSLGNDTDLCQGQNYLINISSSGNQNYLWSDNSTGSSYTISSAGKYWVQITENNCSAADTINATYTALPVFNLGNDTNLCENETLTLDATTVTAIYNWQDNASLATYTVTIAGKYWVDVSVNGCSSSDSIIVSYTASPKVNLGNDTTLCGTTSLTFNAFNANASYLWSDNSTQSSLTANTAGTYWAIATVNNCSDTDSISLTYTAQPNINIGNDTSICENTNITLDATTTNAAAYLWSDNSSASTMQTSGAGLYWVKVSVTPCVAYDSISISEIALPTVDLGDDKIICLGDSVTLDATTSGATYLWPDGSSNPTFTVADTGNYTVSVTTICGTATDDINVDTVSCECFVYVPNSFSPNHDQLNEIFIPVFECSFLEYEFSIYDRFGQQIFTTNESSQGWDGKINGNLAEVGIYTWHLDYKGSALPKKVLKSEYGWVSLLR